MLNVTNIRNDFPMLQGKKMHDQPLVYLDNAATTFKPYAVANAVTNYYLNMTANAHRGDYDLSHDVDEAFENVREKVANFIHADAREIVFTSGASGSLNLVAYGIAEKFLNEGDEVLLTQAEHASNVLPWFKISETMGITINYIPLDEDGRLTADNLRKVISPKTKVVSIAHVTNVMGFIVDIPSIAKVTHDVGALLVVDGAQSVPHMTTDVRQMDCDFLCFSAHKMVGPTGVGVLYGKYHLLDQIPPLLMGGGMSTRFDTCGDITLKRPPHKFEAGTPPIEGVLGLGAAIDYLNSIGMDNIHAYEQELRTSSIAKVTHDVGALLVVDGAQSVPHMTTDVRQMDCDFLCFSAHKMVGPTGVGVLYGKYHLLDQMPPLLMGGGMSTRFDTCGDITLKRPPHKFEAGTPPIEGVLGLGAAIDYLKSIGMDNIHAYEQELRTYTIAKLKSLDNVILYNEKADAGIITFNIKDVFAQDAASLFNTYGVAVRAGQHCAKILMDYLGTVATIRASFYFYNTKEDIDTFVEVIKKGKDFLDAYFI